jgi:hypothetical protein
VVLVERPTTYEDLLACHGTREQARFFLRDRSLDADEVEARHAAFHAHRRAVLGAIPADWRRAVAPRAELPHVLFEPDDVVVVLGQDGLVANVARYLDGQPVIGLNPEPDRFPGVLVAHPPEAAADLLADVARGRATLRERTMARAELDDGQALVALNEVFVGHRSHQSARYVLDLGGRRERQSSSGLIVTTGTGATGWAASIARGRGVPLPGPSDRELTLLVREPWPSAATGTELVTGAVAPPGLVAVTSEMGDGGVVFGDGLEADHLRLDWGQTVRIGVAATALRLVA